MKVAFNLNAPFAGALMGYDWIFDVLEDLKSFAQANGLPALAAKAEEALIVAAQEVAALDAAPVKVPPRQSGSTH
jgi:hypothetical protein